MARPRCSRTTSRAGLRRATGGPPVAVVVPILSTVEARAYVDRLRAETRRIVFTAGVFDLLHPGHLRQLQHARGLGDALIVGVSSDRSVRAIKGSARPINPEGERAEVLAALDCVDAVVVFGEDSPHALVALLQPDVLVTGADRPEQAIAGRDIVVARGGRVVRGPLHPGYSTARIIERIRKRT